MYKTVSVDVIIFIDLTMYPRECFLSLCNLTLPHITGQGETLVDKRAQHLMYQACIVSND